LAVAPKVQKHPGIREGPDKVCNVIRLRGLEWSSPREPIITDSPAEFVVRPPFVSPISIHINTGTLVTWGDQLSGLVPKAVCGPRVSIPVRVSDRYDIKVVVVKEPIQRVVLGGIRDEPVGEVQSC